MAELRNIKDSAPNAALIENLERMLADAKSGELRSMVWICGWNDDQVSHGWAHDHRNSRRRLLAEVLMLQHDWVTNTEFAEGDSILANAFYDL